MDEWNVYSLISANNKYGNRASSYNAPFKVRYTEYGGSTGDAMLPLIFLFNYNMALLGVIFPTYFWPYKRNSNGVCPH